MTDHRDRIESQAKAIVEAGAATDDALRELLVLACHSSRIADAFLADRLDDEAILARLVPIALDEEGHGGDAPMEAAYRVERYPPRLLRAHADALLGGFPVPEVGYNDALAVALAKTGAQDVEKRILAANAAGALTAAGFERALAALRASEGR